MRLYVDNGIIEEVLGDDGLKERGRKHWQSETLRAIKLLKQSFIADYVVLGGGNAKRIEPLPEGFERGHNRNAYAGGVRLWETDPATREPRWRIIQGSLGWAASWGKFETCLPWRCAS